MAAAKEWSTRPSTLLQIQDPVLALMIDLEATRRAVEIRAGEETPADLIQW